MATKTQREFRKQMKELKKDGKLPDTYYSRRRRITYTSGGSILLIIFLAWRFGLLNLILFPILTLVSMFQGYGVSPNDEFADYAMSSQEISDYAKAVADVDTFSDGVFMDFYHHFNGTEEVPKDTFTQYKAELTNQYEKVAVDNEYLTDIAESYKEELGITEELIDFALAHYGESLTAMDDKYVNTLVKKSQEIEDKRSQFWNKLEP